MSSVRFLLFLIFKILLFAADSARLRFKNLFNFYQNVFTFFTAALFFLL